MRNFLNPQKKYKFFYTTVSFKSLLKKLYHTTAKNLLHYSTKFKEITLPSTTAHIVLCDPFKNKNKKVTLNKLKARRRKNN